MKPFGKLSKKMAEASKINQNWMIGKEEKKKKKRRKRKRRRRRRRGR